MNRKGTPWVVVAAAGAALLLAIVAGGANAHRVDHGTVTADAVVVTLSHAFGAPPMFAPYRIIAPGEEVAFQTGRSDRLGRVSFVPDRQGEWRVIVSTEDGHGADVPVAVGEDLTLAGVQTSNRGVLERIGAGVGYLLGAAGMLVLWRQRRADGDAGGVGTG